MSNWLEKEKHKMRSKLEDLDNKQHEEFLNYMDTGEAKYENRRYKAEHEAEEISKFLYAEENAERYKKKCREYEDFIQRIKDKIQQLKKEYPGINYPDADYVLSRIYSLIEMENI